MSHHFDLAAAFADPRLNIADLYVFDTTTGRTAMVLTVNPNAADAVAAFHPDAAYTVHFDVDGSGTGTAFQARVSGAGVLTVSRVVDDAADGAPPTADPVISGPLDSVLHDGDILAFAGVVMDPFAGDGASLQAFGQAASQGRYAPEVFAGGADLFGGRRVAAIVIEVPDAVIGAGPTRAWASTELSEAQRQQQVSRWGLPLVTHVPLGADPAARDAYNTTPPGADTVSDSLIASAIVGLVTLAGTSADPAAYAARFTERFPGSRLPYTIGTPATFDFTGVNGRPLLDDAMDVILSLLTNSPLGDSVRPDPANIDHAFPYVRRSRA